MPERDCASCNEVQQRLWGCNGNAELPVDLFKETLTTCPRRPIKDDPAGFGYWLRMYKHYRKGHFPDPGPVLDQSAYVLRVFDILDAVYGEIEEYQREQARKKQWQQGQGAQGGGGRVLTSRG